MERVSERRYLIEGGWVGASLKKRPITEARYKEDKGRTKLKEAALSNEWRKCRGRDIADAPLWRDPLLTSEGRAVGNSPAGGCKGG